MLERNLPHCQAGGALWQESSPLASKEVMFSLRQTDSGSGTRACRQDALWSLCWIQIPFSTSFLCSRWYKFWVVSSWRGPLSAHVLYSKTSQNTTASQAIMFCSPRVPEGSFWKHFSLHFLLGNNLLKLGFFFCFALLFFVLFGLFLCELYSLNTSIAGLQENGWFRLHCTRCPIWWLWRVTTSIYRSVYTKGPSQCPSSTLAWQLKLFSVELLDQGGLWNTWFKSVL